MANISQRDGTLATNTFAHDGRVTDALTKESTRSFSLIKVFYLFAWRAPSDESSLPRRFDWSGRHLEQSEAHK